MKTIVIEDASLTRILSARIFDYLFNSLVSYIFLFFLKIDSIVHAIIYISILIFIYLLYFVFVPSFFQSQTLGKMIFKIKVLNWEIKEPIKLWMIFKREFYFLFSIHLLNLTIQFISAIFYIYKISNDIGYSFSVIGYVLYVLWCLYLILSIKTQSENLSSIDIKLKSKVFYVHKSNLSVKKETDNRSNIPGYINENLLKEIENIDYKELDLDDK